MTKKQREKLLRDAESAGGEGGFGGAKDEKCKALANVKVGDKLEAVGLKGKDKELNGTAGTVEEVVGFSNSRRFRVRFSTLVINAAGDLDEKHIVKILDADEACLPGTGPAVESSTAPAEEE